MNLTDQKSSRWAMTAAVLLFLAVAFGAFGAHALKEHLTPYSKEIYEKANFYHFIHALAILLTTILIKLELVTNLAQKSLWLFLIGTLIFSTTLYLLAITGIKWLGAITPIGGTLLLASWLILALSSRPKTN